MLGLLALTWRASYCAPETLSALRRKGRREGSRLTRAARWELVARCYAPYAIGCFLLFPALFLPLGPWAAFSVLCNSLLADLLTNLHTFLVVGPNHTGEDLYRSRRASLESDVCAWRAGAGAPVAQPRARSLGVLSASGEDAGPLRQSEKSPLDLAWRLPIPWAQRVECGPREGDVPDVQGLRGGAANGARRGTAHRRGG